MNKLTIAGLQFDRPLFLLLYLLLPTIFFGYLRYQGSKKASAVKFAAIDLFSTSPLPRKRRHIPFILATCAVITMIAGAADPFVQGSVFSQKKQVIVVLDVSKSMEAKDVAPSRIVAAKEGASRFLDQLPSGFEVGLVSFSDVARVVSTPTTNRLYLKSQIDALITMSGTATGDALIQALGLLGEESEGGVIVLLSDGRQTSGVATVEQAAGALKGAGVSVYAIALGTSEGMVSVFDPANGDLINIEVPPDPAGLELLTSITGGKTFSAVTVDELNTIYDSVGGSIKPRAGWVSIGWTLSLLALSFLTLSGFALRSFGRVR